MQDDLEKLVVPRHHRAEIVYGVAAFVFGLFLVSQLGTQLVWKSGLPFARQPGFAATVAITGMLIFGALELRSAWSRRRVAADESIVPEIAHWAKAIEYALWFMVYVWLVPYAGYLFTTLVFCLLLTLRLGYRDKKILLAALLTGLATVVVFKGFLSVKIPGGVVYEWLPDGIRNFMILYF